MLVHYYDPILIMLNNLVMEAPGNSVLATMNCRPLELSFQFNSWFSFACNVKCITALSLGCDTNGQEGLHAETVLYLAKGWYQSEQVYKNSQNLTETRSNHQRNCHHKEEGEVRFIHKVREGNERHK